MSLVFYLLVAAAVIAALAVLLVLVRRAGSGGTGSGLRRKDRSSTIREATRRLTLNPRDAEALQALADLYFEEQDFGNAFKYYQSLLPLCAANPIIDEFAVTLHYAESAYNLKNYDEAYRAFMLARNFDGDNFEVNYNLGVLEYGRKNYPKAAACLRKAVAVRPDHAPSQRYLGQTLYLLQEYKEAIAALRRALDQEPEDKGSQFVLAKSHLAENANDPALVIFSRLRTDPEYGPQAALYAGTIRLNTKQYAEAIADFEIGLRHGNLPPSVALELKYRLAMALVKQGDLAAAIKLWKEVAAAQPDYRDAGELLARYQEINTSRHLSSFLIAPSAEFLTLCRKIAAKYFGSASAKLLSLTLHRSEYADILAKVHTPQWEEFVLFRFLRTAGSVGELMLRDFYGRLKELRAGRGICVTAGSFSEAARGFVEARMIDLVEKEGLLKLFKRL